MVQLGPCLGLGDLGLMQEEIEDCWLDDLDEIGALPPVEDEDDE